MTDASPSAKRLLIGAGSFADALGALRLAERLADTMIGDLGGVLVEETVITEIAELPGQRIVTSSGTLVVAPTQHQVRTLMESDARAFRDSLSGLARARTRSWTFERRRGDLISGLCDAAASWDLLLLGYRQMRRRAGRLVLIVPPGAGSQAAVDLAGSLVKALHTDLVVLAMTAGGPDPGVAGPGAELFPSEAAMLERISHIYAAAVVLDLAAGPLRTHDQLRQLLGVARCPVLVLGAGAGEPSIAHTTQIPPAP